MSTFPFRVKALFEYSSPHDDDLQFGAGQVIAVTAEEDDDWYSGEFVDDSGAKHEGIFPRNFVEKFEPTAPPRPTRRAKKEPEAAPKDEPHDAIQPAQAAPASLRAPEPEAEEKPLPLRSPRTTESPPPAAPLSQTAKSPEIPTSPTMPAPAAKASNAQVKQAAPPPVSEKPTTSAFKDRIAAFNKAGSAPIIPFKPGGASFVKKPFVPPPPSRDAFVPPARTEPPPAKIYRREEDPEIKETEIENQENAMRAGLAAASSNDGEDEDQPKPTSLKERIALLQKQQMEAAQRHAEAATKKEKPKRPPKKRTESTEPAPASTETEAAALQPSLERQDTEDTGEKRSMDEPGSPRVLPPRRKSSKGPATDSFNDGNEADMSGAGDTTEDQDELTERDESDEKPKHTSRPTPAAAEMEQDEDDDDEQAEDDDDVDPEIRRKEELRARMAKLGGMGMHGLFGPPGMMPMPGAAPPKKKRTPSTKERTSLDELENDHAASSRGAPPIPTMMALPGMSHTRQEEEASSDRDEPEPTPKGPPPPPARLDPADDSGMVEDESDEHTPAPVTRGLSGPPHVPGSRPAPPPIPTEARTPSLPVRAEVKSPSAGSESDDELSEYAQPTSLDAPRGEAPPVMRSPPPLPPSIPSPTMPSSRAPPLPSAGPRGGEESPTSPASPQMASSRRASRPPPPIPGAPPVVLAAQSRPAPPPPPGPALDKPTPSPRPENEQEEPTEYEGDYDTDIASSVPHKDALKSHGRESSFEELASLKSPAAEAPPSAPPPIPTSAVPRGMPPPIPSQPPPDKRRSVDAPRAAPPPPPSKEASVEHRENEHDSHIYSAPRHSSSHPPRTPKIEEETYFPDTLGIPSPPLDRRAPPAPQTPNRAPPKQSLDAQRTGGKRSIDVSGSAAESGFIACDLDVALQTGWWRQANQVPPVLQGRRDVYYESEESTSTNRGARTEITRVISVLFQDYSKTILTTRYDPYDPSDVDIEQRHEPPPRTLRQDQLEQSYERYGRFIAEAVHAKKDTVVADGSPQGLVYDLLRPFKDALLPVGTRAYGALVYANMANASTQQNDQIRPGDIISIRNAKFQGKHGLGKYSMEVGKPDHVAVVSEWDGTKKKVRAWEQGRDHKKVKLESFRLDDLRSGEVKIWRVMPRGWVGLNTQP